ncbi:molybdopterin-dependent oxidoreductase [Microbacterium sp. NPDC077184]|uniref:molybdopterin-dependent oxidoreductase n=1 Tax=Microbacterium sp. NPDC077184 TaxID=3154764 RepID=UPI003424FD2C
MSGARSGRTASHWGSYLVDTLDDEVVGVVPVPEDPDPSPIGQNYRGRLRGGPRITAPAVRRGWLDQRSRTGRGSDDFVEVTTSEAVELVASELERVRSQFGNESIFGGSYGWGSAGRFHHAQSQIHRFLNSIGGYTRSVNTYSHAADEVILPHLVGDRAEFLRSVPSWEEIAAHTQEFIAFGGLPARSTQVNPGGVGAHVNLAGQQSAAEAGVNFTLITPVRTDTVDQLGGQWVPLRPNTDVALMLGLAHTVLDAGLADVEFLEECCVGWERVHAELTGRIDGRVKDAEWAAEITGIPASTIVDLGHRIGSRRSLIAVTWSLQRQHHGEMAYWAALTLAAMSGSLGRPGGGFGTGYSSMHNAHVWDRVSPAAALPQGRNAVRSFIPVARIADLLLHPGEEFDYNGRTSIYPDIRLVYWVGGNPFHHHQDLNRLTRAWEKPETIVVHEPYWNALAKRADIVFPAATSLEREDFAIGMADNWLSWMDRVADPPPGVVTDYETFAEIADRMGVGHDFTEGRAPEEWISLLWDQTRSKAGDLGFELPDLETFRSRGSIRLDMPRVAPTAFSELRREPREHPLTTPSGKIELHSATIESFGYADCPGWARWMEPAEWLGADLANTYPFHLVSPQPDGKLHSQYDHGSESRRHKIDGRTVVRLSTEDATERGLTDGDVVRIFNARGACLAAVRVDAGVRPGVVSLPTGAWFDPVDPSEPGSLDRHGNPNVLTLDIGTSSLAQGPSAHTCLVDIERLDGAPPPVDAHRPPPIRPRYQTPTHRGDTP